jgi:hypothetical protein
MLTTMGFYGLVLGTLAVWRITHLLHAENGPWDLVARMRDRAGRVAGRVFDCFYCLSLWIAIPFAALLGTGWLERALLWPALSAGAILLERVTREPEAVAPVAPVAPWHFDEENDHALLRQSRPAQRHDNDSSWTDA